MVVGQRAVTLSAGRCPLRAPRPAGRRRNLMRDEGPVATRGTCALRRARHHRVKATVGAHEARSRARRASPPSPHHRIAEGTGRRSIIAFRGPGNDRYEGVSVARRCEIHGGGAAGRDALRGQAPASCAPPRWSTPQSDARRRTSGYARDLRSSPRTTPSRQGDGGGARSALPRAESVTAVAPPLRSTRDRIPGEQALIWPPAHR